jgi:molybdate transport system substrate-binding protein
MRASEVWAAVVTLLMLTEPSRRTAALPKVRAHCTLRLLRVRSTGIRTLKFWLRISSTVLFASLAVLGQRSQATAAELKILAPRSMWTVLKEIGPQFEASSGYKLTVVTGIAATLADRIIEAEPFDIFIGPPVQMDRLVQANRVIADTRTSIARSGIGVEVRAGARKPDISSVDSFKRALLNAKSIGYLKQDGTSGAYLHGLLERLEIADAIKAKVVRPQTDIVSELVANGEIGLGLVVMTQIMTTPGVDLVGPIPHEIQSYVRWSGVVSAHSTAPQVAKDLLDFLTGPTALPVLKAQGMEPG